MFKSMAKAARNHLKGTKKFSTFTNGLATKSVKQFDLEVNRLVWIDLEMTGLNIENDTILEAACIVTDSDLNIVAEAPTIVIHHSKEILDNMNEWCRKQHGKTGLTQACLESNVTLPQAESTLLDFISKYTTEKMSPLAGNTVYMDRLFIQKYMPKVNNHLHYRIVDVSTVKELCRRWNPIVYNNTPKKDLSHRALSDIRESIEELKYYRKSFFKSQ